MPLVKTPDVVKGDPGNILISEVYNNIQSVAVFLK